MNNCEDDFWIVNFGGEQFKVSPLDDSHGTKSATEKNSERNGLKGDNYTNFIEKVL